MASNDHGPWRLALRGRRLFPLHHVSHGLPIQTSQSQLHDEDLPPKHQCKRIYLPRHFAGSMVSCVDHLKGPPFNLLDAYGSQPGGPVGAGYCAFVQDGQDPVRGDGERVDKEVCHVAG
jgi:hypothetical protein